MTEIPKPPRPPEPTNVLGGGLIPKRTVPAYIPPPPLVTVPSYVEDESFELYPWVMFCIGFFAGLIFMKFIC